MSKRAEYWRSRMQQWRESGLNRADFCRRHQINYYSMSSWVRRFRLSGELETPRRGRTDRFVEVSVANGAPDGVQGRYEIVLGSGRILRVAEDFDDGALARLIRTVESC